MFSIPNLSRSPLVQFDINALLHPSQHPVNNYQVTCSSKQYIHPVKRDKAKASMTAKERSELWKRFQHLDMTEYPNQGRARQIRNANLSYPRFPEANSDIQHPHPVSPDYDIPRSYPIPANYDIPRSYPVPADYDIPRPYPVSADYDILRPYPISTDYDIPRRYPVYSMNSNSPRETIPQKKPR